MTKPNTSAPDFHALRKDCLLVIRDAGQDPVAFCQRIVDDLFAAIPQFPIIGSIEHQAALKIIEQSVNQTLNQ